MPKSLNTIVCNNNLSDSHTALHNNTVTALTKHYATNAEHEENMDILCENIPNKFMWNKGSKNGLLG